MPVVVTVTGPGVTLTATPTSSSAPSSLSAASVAGIVTGTLLGGVSLIALVLYLLNRYRRPKFTRVVNPARDHVPAKGAPNLRHLPSASARRPGFLTGHSHKPSLSSEPLISPVPPPPSTLQARSSSTLRSDSSYPGIRDNQYSSDDLGQISQVAGSGAVSYSATPAVLNIPPDRKPEQALRQSGVCDTPRHPRRTSGDDVPSPSTSPKPQPQMFIHRMLQMRAQASEGVSLAYRDSPDFLSSRSTTQDSSSFHADEERLLAEAERTAPRNAEIVQGDEKMMPDDDGDDDWGEVASSESVYSQPSAPTDHSVFLSDPVSRPNTSLSMPRRNSSRMQTRTPAPPPELSPVAEVPEAPRAFEGQTDSGRVSAAGNSSLDGQVSHGTGSSVFDQSGALPLLTSTNFGKGSTTPGTPPGSLSSTTGWASGSSGGASRYPSLAPSSIGGSSRSGPRSDTSTDWHHPPSGLAGLASLQIGSLRNPHSPVEEQPELPEVSPTPVPVDPVPVKRAHLRGGTAGSMPEVERRTVLQGGIAHIDVVL